MVTSQHRLAGGLSLGGTAAPAWGLMICCHRDSAALTPVSLRSISLFCPTTGIRRLCSCKEWFVSLTWEHLFCFQRSSTTLLLLSCEISDYNCLNPCDVMNFQEGKPPCTISLKVGYILSGLSDWPWIYVKPTLWNILFQMLSISHKALPHQSLEALPSWWYFFYHRHLHNIQPWDCIYFKPSGILLFHCLIGNYTRV